MRRVLDAILPRGSAWVPVVDGGFDRLLNGLGDGLEDLRAFLFTLALIREPESTFILDDLEREYGVVNDTGLTEAVRRTYLHGVKYGAIGLGTADDVQARLRAAGFTNVFVYQNDPAIDPDGFPAAGVELLVNGELEDHPITYLMPDQVEFWPFVFFIGGAKTKFENFIDWNMEYGSTLYWPDGNGGIITKTTQVKQSGLRSLSVACVGATVTDQHMTPDATDPDILSAYRMTETSTATGTRTPGLIARNLLIDGDMNQTGVASWVAATATLTKESGSPYSGRFSLRVLGTGGSVGWARQARIINGRDYTIVGRARSIDLSTAPRIADPTANRWTGTASGSWQTINVSWTAAGTGNISLGGDAVDGSVEFDVMVLTDDNFMFPGGTNTNVLPVTSPLIEGLEFDPGATSKIELVDDAILNGDFALAAGWTPGADWTIAAGVAAFSRPAAGATDLVQTGANSNAGLVVPGGLYRVTLTITNLVNASLRPKIGGTLGTLRAGNGTFTEDIRAGTADSFDFVGTAGGGGGVLDLDDVFCELIDESFWHENLTVELIFEQDIAAGTGGLWSNQTGGALSQYLAKSGGGRIYFGTIVGVLQKEVNSAILGTNRYYHVICVRSYDGTDTTLSLYIDGVLVDSNSWAGAPDVTVSNTPLLGLRAVGQYFDGTLADHVSFFAGDKDQTWVDAQFTAYQAALLAGPYASQELDPEVTDSRTLTAAAFAVDDTIGDPFPMIMVQLPDDSWEIAFVGDTHTVNPLGLQAVSFSLPSGIKVARLFCKNADTGETAFDDVSIDGTLIARINIDAELEDKFKRLILGAKPVHSWAGLLVDFA